MIHCNEPSQGEAQLPQAASRATLANAALFLGDRAAAALHYLAEAASFARELGRDPWDFAVEIQTVRELGLTKNDLRWLLCQGFVEHRREITAVGDTCRVFQPDRPLSFSENACFVLSEGGLAFAGNGLVFPANAHAAAEPPSPAGGNGHGKDLLPKWDRDRQELRVGNIVVKQFKVPALNQERILAAFEEEGWPVHIDDPLPPHREQDPKRRLHDTIVSLNRSQKNPLIHFLGNGNGLGIRWRLGSGRNGEHHGEDSAGP